MASYTPKIGLHQWEPSDNFLRSDFNEDFAKIDKAFQQAASGDNDLKVLADSKVRMVTGYYVGTGTENTKTINLGFYPLGLIVDPGLGYRPALGSDKSGAYGGLAIRGNSVGQNTKSFSITSTGFTVTGYTNCLGLQYLYLAFV